MRLLVIAATEMEIQPFIDSKPDVDVLISGVGSPSTLYQLVKKLSVQRYDFVLQAGIAGRCAHSLIKLAECALIDSDVFADLGVQEKGAFFTLADLNFTSADEFPFTNGWLVNDNNCLSNFSLPQVSGLTVNKISDDIFQSELYSSKYGGELESLEGAALHYVCLLERIPFLQLRSVSNDVGVRDKTKWRIRDAISNLNQELVGIIQILKSI